MAKIVFSMAGEGRGHATRVRAVVEQLRREHEIILLAPNFAYELLADAYRSTIGVTVGKIPGLSFHYKRNNKLDYGKSLLGSIPFLWKLRTCVDRVEARLRREQPDLAITDFEPILPRAAARCGLPYISFDHQHFLKVNDLSDLPWHLRLRAWLVALPIGLFYDQQIRTVVSSFYAPPLKPKYRDVVQVGTLLRPEVLAATPVEGDHLLVYMRRFMRSNLLEALRSCGRPVRIYGLGPRARDGNLSYFDVDEAGFLENLSSCHAVISNAGNQLAGEAMYLRKPMLALPESGNFEQSINGHFLRASGCGDWMCFNKINATDLQSFLARVPRMRLRIDPQRVVGNDLALQVIRQELRHATASRPAAALQVA